MDNISNSNSNSSSIASQMKKSNEKSEENVEKLGEVEKHIKENTEILKKMMLESKKKNQ